MSKTLLLADDSTTIQRVVALTFAQEDIRVVAVSDGEQAVKSIERDHPDIVLADVGMPRLDGYSVSSHIKSSAALQHIPVLLLAGAFEPVDEARARAAQCDGVLIKPFEPRLLVARVQELLNAARPPRAPVPTEGAADADHDVSGPGAPAMSSTAEPGHAVPSWYKPETHVTDRPAVPALDADDADELDGKLVSLTAGMAPAARDDDSTAAAAGLESGPEPLILDLGSFTPVHGTGPARLEWTEPRGPEPLELAPLPGSMSSTAGPEEPPALAVVAAPAVGKVSLATAFSALLAAEQSMPSAGAVPAGVSESALEDVVRRVLLTDDRVRRMVLEAAERMVKEEIERIKSAPDAADDAGPETQ